MEKNLITITITMATVITLFTAGTVSAQSLNWIVPGSQTGGYLMISKSIVDPINTTGPEIKIEVAGNCVNGMKKFRNANDPTAMIYILDPESDPGDKGCEFESAAVVKESVTAHLLQAPTALCTMDKSLTAAKLQSGKEFTVALPRTKSKRLANALNQLDIKHKIVRYENSGSSVRGMMGGDTAVSLTNPGMSGAVIAAGGQCLFVLGDKSFKDMPSTKKVFGKNIDYSDTDYVLLTKNLSQEQRKKLISTIEKVKMSDQFKTYSEKAWMFIPQKTDLNKMIDVAVQELVFKTY